MENTIEIKENEVKERPNDFDLGSYVRSKFYESIEEYDECVTCGQKSPYSKRTHIDLRVGYVEGGGQGCFKPSICSK